MDENEDSISEDQSSSENQSISENVASTSTEDQSMESEKQDNVSKVVEIKARISAEIEKVENDIIEIQKVKQESIEKIELKKKELRELSGAIEICEEKDETMREMKEREKEIQERKISLTALDETIANLDKQIGEIQAQHDKATSDLVMKRRKLNEQLRYYDSLNQRLRELLELIQSETKRHEDKLKELAQIRSEVLKRTDLTEEEMKKLIKELDDQIEASNKEHNYLIDCYNKKLSGIQISEPSTVQDIKGEDLDAQILTDEQIQQIEQYETALYQKKHRMSNEERLKLLRSGFQVTPSGRIIAQDKIISLRDARLQGLLAEDEEYGEEEMEITPTEILKEIMPKEVCYSSTTSVSSSERSSSIESELDLHDINYLKRVFGKSLSLALAEITAVQPADPIHYLAHWFIKYRYNQEIDDVKRLELQALMIERDRLEAERWHKELEEEANLAVLEALFRAENIIMQQDFLKMEMLEMEGESIGDLLASNALNA